MWARGCEKGKRQNQEAEVRGAYAEENKKLGMSVAAHNPAKFGLETAGVSRVGLILCS